MVGWFVGGTVVVAGVGWIVGGTVVIAVGAFVGRIVGTFVGDTVVG